MTTTFFYAPYLGSNHEDRRDARVRLVDFDEASTTSLVEFPDGYRLVIPSGELIVRDA